MKKHMQKHALTPKEKIRKKCRAVRQKKYQKWQKNKILKIKKASIFKGLCIVSKMSEKHAENLT